MVGPGVQDQKSANAASILLDSNDAIVTSGKILASVYEPGKHYLDDALAKPQSAQREEKNWPI